jgi:small subunit ribosomal protein S16
MLMIRYFKTGKKNQPFFKIVVTEKTNPPHAGRFVDEVGFFNPLTKEKKVMAEKVKHWLSVGAKPSDTVYNLLISEKVIEGKKIQVHKKSKKEEKKKEEAQAPKAAEPEKAVEQPSPAPEEKKEESVQEAEKKEEQPAQKEEQGTEH